METNKTTIDAILNAIRGELSEFLEEERSITCPIEYENKVFQVAMKFARSLLEEGQGEVPRSRNVKKK